MVLSTIRRLSVPVMLVLFLLLTSFSSLASGTALAQTRATHCTLCPLPTRSLSVASNTVPKAATGTLSISSLYLADGSNNKKTAFVPGATIHYVVRVNNTSGSTITATIQYWAYWGKSFANTSPYAAIYVQTYQNVSVPTGSPGYYVASTIPSWATPGSYTYQINVWDQSNTANKSTASTIFWVTGTKSILNAQGNTVPYYSQYCTTNSTQNYDCGPASDAMVLSYWGKISSSLTRCQQIAYVRQTIINAYGNYVDTTGPQLINALIHYNNGTSNGVLYYSFAQSISGGTTPYVQESDIAAAIAQNDPVIELINAQALGRSYTGHWIVVIGVTSDGTNTYFIVNDPDSNYTSNQTAKIWLPTFGNAITTAPADYNIDGIVGYV